MNRQEPLASRMRPRTLDEFFGQSHILGRGRLLRRTIQADRLSSLIFYGPPGTGKTTLARIIASTTKSVFQGMNAVMAGKKDIREAIDSAEQIRQKSGQKFILFIDEVHRFNKAQQDALLPNVENGLLTLIGATAENPYFEVNKALLSRSRVFQFKSLTDSDLLEIANAALTDKDRGFGKLNISLEPGVLEHLVKTANGDARAILNALELAIETPGKEKDKIHISLNDAEECIQRKAVLYDRDGDAHYDTVSAFIKSIRGSDPDAALYWMAKMIYAGEDPRFIFRRMLIAASEDIGLADPGALGIVLDAARAFDYVGMPEGQYHLSQACIYLATAPKSNSTMAFFEAISEVEQGKRADIPNHIKDASRDREAEGHGKGYLYPHSFRGHWVAQKYLPEGLKGKIFYQPSSSGYESEIINLVNQRREIQFAALSESADGFEKTGFQSGIKNYWLRRSLQYTGDLLKQVSREIFHILGCGSGHMVFDLSGGKSFLTWEACSICTQGGVWSRCNTSEHFRNMRDWISNFDYMLSPKLIHMPWDDFKTLNDDSGRIYFDGAVGYNLLSEIKLTGMAEALKFLRSNNMNPGAKIVLAEIDYGNSHRFSDLISLFAQNKENNPGGELMQNISIIESDFLSKISKDVDVAVQQVIEDGLKTQVMVKKRKFHSKRYLNRSQIHAWLDCSESEYKHSVLPVLKKTISPEVWKWLVEQLEQNLGNRELNWTQGYTFYCIG